MQSFFHHLNCLSEHIHSRFSVASGIAVSAGQLARIHDVNFSALVSFNSALFDDSFADLVADGGGEISLDGGEKAGEKGEDDKDLSKFHGLSWERDFIDYKLINCL